MGFGRGSYQERCAAGRTLGLVGAGFPDKTKPNLLRPIDRLVFAGAPPK